MNFLKKKYLTPKTDVEKISDRQLLSTLTQSVPKCTSENTCPFNKLWCCEKQRVYDQHTGLIVKSLIKYTFSVRNGMFDGCPYNYESLCYNHKERQRS